MHVIAPELRRLYDSSVQTNDASEWARICRVEAAWTTHGPTREMLLDLAREFEAISSGPQAKVDPDDPALQQSVADRLMGYAARQKLAQGS